MNKKLTKLLSIFLLAGTIGTGIAFTSTACGKKKVEPCEQHVDEDKDGICDVCKEEMPKEEDPKPVATVTGVELASKTEGVTISGGKISVEVEEDKNATVVLEATVKGENLTDKSVTWKVSGTDKLATVSGGTVTISGAVKEGGKVTVTATSVADTTKSASVEITVTVKTPDSVKKSVTFDVKGHGTAPEALSVDEGSKIDEPLAPADESGKFEFEGWYKDSACTTKWDFETDVVSADTVLYANWTEVVVPSIYVKYSLITTGDNGYEVDDKTTIEIKEDGKVLIGTIEGAWTLSEDKEYIVVTYKENETDTENVTLYARELGGVVYVYGSLIEYEADDYFGVYTNGTTVSTALASILDEHKAVFEDPVGTGSKYYLIEENKDRADGDPFYIVDTESVIEIVEADKATINGVQATFVKANENDEYFTVTYHDAEDNEDVTLYVVIERGGVLYVYASLDEFNAGEYDAVYTVKETVGTALGSKLEEDNYCKTSNTLQSGEFQERVDGYTLIVDVEKGEVIYAYDSGDDELETKAELEIDDEVISFTLNDVEYTIEWNGNGYTVIHTTTDDQGHEYRTSQYFTPAVENLLLSAENFAGVFEGEAYITNADKETFKITKIEIGEDGYAVITCIETNADHSAKTGATEFKVGAKHNASDGTADIYNRLKLEGPLCTIFVEATSDEVKSLTVANEQSEDLAKFSKSEATVTAVPAITLDKEGVWKDADKTYTLSYNEGLGWNINDRRITVVGGTTNSLTVYCGIGDGYTNYVISVSAESIVVYAADGTTAIVTLTPYVQEEEAPQNLVADGTTNNTYTGDSEHGYFIVGQTGWYTFDITDGTVFIDFDTDGVPDMWGLNNVDSWSTNKTRQLTQGDKIAIASGVSFKATYSAEAPASTSISDVYGTYSGLTSGTDTVYIAVSSDKAKIKVGTNDAVIFESLVTDNEMLDSMGWTRYNLSSTNTDTALIVKIAGTTVTVSVELYYGVDDARNATYDLTLDISSKGTLATDEFTTGGNQSQDPNPNDPDPDDEFAGFPQAVQGKHHGTITHGGDECVIEVEITATGAVLTIYDEVDEPVGFFDNKTLTYVETDEEYETITIWSCTTATQDTYLFKIIVMGEAICIEDITANNGGWFSGQAELVAGAAEFEAGEVTIITVGENEDIELTSKDSVKFTATAAGLYEFSLAYTNDALSGGEGKEIGTFMSPTLVLSLAANESVEFKPAYGQFSGDVIITEISDMVVAANGTLHLGVNYVYVDLENGVNVTIPEGMYDLTWDMSSNLSVSDAADHEVNIGQGFVQASASGKAIYVTHWAGGYQTITLANATVLNDGDYITTSNGNVFVNLDANGTATLTITKMGDYYLYVTTEDSTYEKAATISSDAYDDSEYKYVVGENGATITLTASTDWTGGVVTISVYGTPPEELEDTYNISFTYTDSTITPAEFLEGKPVIFVVGDSSYQWANDTELKFNAGCKLIFTVPGEVTFNWHTAPYGGDSHIIKTYDDEGYCTVEFIKNNSYVYSISIDTTSIMDETQKVTVTFNDGTDTTDVEVYEGNYVAKPADPTKEGWTFAGWYTEEEEGEEFDFDEPVTEDVEIFAHWTAGAKVYQTITTAMNYNSKTVIIGSVTHTANISGSSHVDNDYFNVKVLTRKPGDWMDMGSITFTVAKGASVTVYGQYSATLTLKVYNGDTQVGETKELGTNDAYEETYTWAELGGGNDALTIVIESKTSGGFVGGVEVTFPD